MMFTKPDPYMNCTIREALKISFLLLSFLSFSRSPLHAQQAQVREEVRNLLTYPFSDPDPVPILTTNPKIYPYFTFDGYSHEGQSQNWKVVKMENEYIEVYILPEVGGKVWGAIEKSTGGEFLYRNEVMKFRNISMRGPWTSGGIEFNFGIIGHHPSTATPVDYLVQEHPDGSVSCTVGNIDLPSRTQWRVKIVLPPDKAYFETQASWYNPTPLQQSYYNWMTGAAAAGNDLEFYTPGDQYLEHSGEAKPWPIDEKGRNLSRYRENAFGPSKSYHVVGTYDDYFGGYFHDSGFGFGHWAEYEEMPGQKLWLWALSRSGGIWEDLLTDTDGQYIEFQAGRLFVQYSPGEHQNPITQVAFPPYTTDQWSELWFPVKEIGGMKEVSPVAVMNVDTANGQLQVGINALAETTGRLFIIADGNVLHAKALEMQPMEVYRDTVELNGATEYDVVVPEMELLYYSDSKYKLLDRPFDREGMVSIPQDDADMLYRQALEDLKFRQYEQAIDKLQEGLERNPFHQGALVTLSELYYRKAEYVNALSYARKALQLDTYNAYANFMAGNIYRAQEDWINALESFGWAARSMEFRSAAYGEMAAIYLLREDFQRAKKYAQKALDFNRYNVLALQVMAIQARKTDDEATANTILKHLLDMDPLNHFAYYEKYLHSGALADRDRFQQMNRSELAYQTYLELAITYHRLGQDPEAVGVLDRAPQHALVDLWWCYLQKDASPQQSADYFAGIRDLSPDFVFPFRTESLKVLRWATAQSNHWLHKYYLALLYWSLDRPAEAAQLMKSAGNRPDYAPFFVARARLLQQVEQKDQLNDLQTALRLNPDDFRNWRAVTQYHAVNSSPERTLLQAKAAHEKFPEHYATAMDYARALLQQQDYEAGHRLLQNIRVLPFEGAYEGRSLYEKAQVGRALRLMERQQFEEAIPVLIAAKQWPENLGVGKPYDPDDRLPNYLLSYCYNQTGKEQSTKTYLEFVVETTQQRIGQKSVLHLLGLLAADKLATVQSTTLLSAIMNAPHHNSPETQWVLAHYQGDEDRVIQLKDEHQALARNDLIRLLEQLSGF